MKVKSQKKEKNQALGYILSLAAMAAVVAVFAAAVLNFSGRTGAREEETLRLLYPTYSRHTMRSRPHGY